METVTETQHAAWRQAIAAQLKAERALRGLDQESVCEATGISRSTYSRMERGSGATLDQLVSIAHVFDLSLPDLMGRAEAEMQRRESNPPAPQRPRKMHATATTTKRKKAPAERQITKSSRR